MSLLFRLAMSAASECPSQKSFEGVEGVFDRALILERIFVGNQRTQPHRLFSQCSDPC
jgi:hypothetical protein